MKGATGKASKKEQSKSGAAQSADIARWGMNLQDTIDNDDWSSAWQEVLEGKGVWGGRTRGGRGVQRITGYTKDISVEGVTLSFSGKELLQRTSLKFVHGHRYGLIGENGVGKSTLLRRMAQQSLPGIPLHFRYGYVQQELPSVDNLRVLDYILRGGRSVESLQEHIESLREEETALEAQLEAESDSERMGVLAESLCDLGEEIETLEQQIAQLQTSSASASASTHADSRKGAASGGNEITRADIEALGKNVVDILDGLGLTKPLRRLSMQVSELSGGWRMRAALAHCLVHLEDVDVLLLDEPTNHLDLPTIAWLQNFLTTHARQHTTIVLFVSHDRAFLSSVATDIVEMKDTQLHYFSSGYEDYVLHQQEMQQRTLHALDARHRREAHIQKTIENAQSRGDDKMAKAKQKKLERAAFTRDLDGHRFKLFSLKAMDEDSVHMPEIIDGTSVQGRDYRMYKFKFPAVDASSLRLPTPATPVLSFDRVSLTYAHRDRVNPGSDKPVLEDVTLQVTLQSRIGILGRNGRGKSTLLQALALAQVGQVLAPQKKTRGGSASVSTSVEAGNPLRVTTGAVHRHHSLRIGVVAQHQIDILAHHLGETPVSYLRLVLRHGTPDFTPSSSATEATSGSETVFTHVQNEVAQSSVATSSADESDQELRALLGACGLSGSLALQPIGALSGGQKARLSFAAVCALRPHLLLLDEPSNHLSLEAIEALAQACRAFQGGIVLVSHNKTLLSQVCNEVLVVANNRVTLRRPLVTHPDDPVETQTAFATLLEACIAEQIRG